jgi:hypothetical protein
VVNRVYGPMDLKQPDPPQTSVTRAVATSLEACAPVATRHGGRPRCSGERKVGLGNVIWVSPEDGGRCSGSATMRGSGS